MPVARSPVQPTLFPLRKKPLPAGKPRVWYIAHNRRLKAMRIAIALLDTGVYTPQQATDRLIHETAARIGVHPPSATTCAQVRKLLPRM
ncbi:hypothetical protein ACFQLX_23720 [Streptomyces polyrhachis]|uniref:Uncharacterized protein n=1 Tax=Streptomyces polyrhachis TaxID=1282885 RepID=A0ABW2GPZ4_9ACTN